MPDTPSRTSSLPGKAGRQPQQTRGRERVEAVLDACAALLSEEGLGELTMHKLAKRATTSIGSLYHFFPDKEAVVEALCHRHLTALAGIRNELDRIAAEQWQAMTTEQVIEGLVRPYLRYIETYPEMLVIISQSLGSRIDEAPALRQSILASYEEVLRLRMPRMDETLLKTITFVLYNIPVGSLQSLQANDEYRERVLRMELIRAMLAYLHTIEQQYASDC